MSVLYALPYIEITQIGTFNIRKDWRHVRLSSFELLFALSLGCITINLFEFNTSIIK